MKKESKNKGYTSEQIHKLLDICDERTKAIILIYASTGMRLRALPSLKVGDLKLLKIYDGESEREDLTDDSPLIREQFDSSDSFKIKHARPVSIQTITKILRQKLLQS